MKPDKFLISRLEKLARIQLQEDEKQLFTHDLTQILQMVDKLQELNTDGVEPLTTPTESHVAHRSDEPGDLLSQEEALKNAPREDGQFFRTPKVIDKQNDQP